LGTTGTGDGFYYYRFKNILMKDISIEEGNRLIAEFMGFQISEWIERDGSFLGYYLLDADGGSDFSDGIDWYNPESNWNQLMPVVEKICSLRYNSPSGGTTSVSVSIAYGHTNFSKDIWAFGEEVMIVNRCGGKTMIENAWQAVVKFIEWYTSRGGGGGVQR
jgi:hypothetical protein